ncbi:hypothetical protein BDY21DRAFT_289521 [Lineolata rhizophorae]|uniref:Integral membrane protein n=1 Tax=Lineolata rhizophorae TaxID=578093 RepID=A0A6A6NV23_9PEZI|nr:hypothetical protein BDY21DRAFT_289521 [Lineolata rhizophorae]
MLRRASVAARSAWQGRGAWAGGGDGGGGGGSSARGSDAGVSATGSGSGRRPSQGPVEEYGPEVVDLLDVVANTPALDPEIATLSTLTNVQNSLFVPDLGRYLNRRPTYVLSRRPSDELARYPTATEGRDESPSGGRRPDARRMATIDTITSRMSETPGHFAVLPHGTSLDGWTMAEKQELNDHVRHMLHSRRSKFKRSMRGFGQYVKRPLGFLVTLYATLITLFGLAWVLFLIGWINVGGRQIYVVHIIDSVLVALFAIVGDGLAPFRAVDTYHMIFVAHYHHLTWKLRRKQRMPALEDKNDLPTKRKSELLTDLEAGLNEALDTQAYSVLSARQQARLDHHATKLAKSHTFYKPHETTTHHAFPLRLLVAIVVLLDCHSLLQISLGACTWGIYYKTRPFAITTVILCVSITCNITAGVLISVGDKRTRKKDVVRRMMRQELTGEAIQHLERRRGKERRRNRGLERDVEVDDGEWDAVKGRVSVYEGT